MKIKIEETDEEEEEEEEESELFPNIFASIFTVIFLCVILFKGEPDIGDYVWKLMKWLLLL